MKFNPPLMIKTNIKSKKIGRTAVIRKLSLKMANKQTLICAGTSIVVTVGLTVLAVRLLRRTLHNRRMKPVSRVTALTIFPIKSCRGISVDSAQCTAMGLQRGKLRDRVFMLITREGGKIINARQEPTLLLVVPCIHENELWLDAPNMETLKIDLDATRLNGNQDILRTRIWDVEVGGVDCGEEISGWFNRYLNRTDVVVIHHNRHIKPKLCKDKDIVQHLVTAGDKAAFADFTCYLLMAEESIADLNSRITNKVGVRNFRGNIQTEGSSPYAEDKWKRVRIGDKARFRNVKLCQRCTAIITDPDTGTRDKTQEALSMLLKYRRARHVEPSMKKFDGEAALLGLHLAFDEEGEIKVGDVVYADQ